MAQLEPRWVHRRRPTARACPLRILDSANRATVTNQPRLSDFASGTDSRDGSDRRGEYIEFFSSPQGSTTPKLRSNRQLPHPRRRNTIEDSYHRIMLATYPRVSKLYNISGQMHEAEISSSSTTCLDSARIMMPPLHDLDEWSFSYGNISGPHFQEVTFDNTTLWSPHRYSVFSDRARKVHLFSSVDFEGEVACHTSLIRLQRRMRDLDVWVLVERKDPASGHWKVLN